MTDKEDELERICFNCNQFFPIIIREPTEFGICLNDNAFEPYIDELLENSNYASCQELIDSKKFSGGQKACDSFDAVECMEIPMDGALERELLHAGKTGKFNLDSLKAAVLEDKISSIDWKNLSVDKHAAQLKSSDTSEQRAAISGLRALIVSGNMRASEELVNFFKQLPPPATIGEVHFKQELLRGMNDMNTRKLLLPPLIHELYRTPSNRTTRQWISDIFRFLEGYSFEELREPLEKMLIDRKFSHKLKAKIKYIMAECER